MMDISPTDMILFKMLILHIRSGVSGGVISRKWNGSSGRLPFALLSQGFSMKPLSCEGRVGVLIRVYAHP